MRLSPLAAAALLPLAFAIGCDSTEKDGAGQGNDTSEPGDDDTAEPGPDYEDGCILVDGSGGYAWIKDAIEVANEGSTIELCPTALHEETVVVDKGVHIVGPGSDQFILNAALNDNAITISSSNASFSR